jgi:hypothetical protein
MLLRYTGSNGAAIVAWLEREGCAGAAEMTDDGLVVDTDRGWLVACPDDVIV